MACLKLEEKFLCRLTRASVWTVEDGESLFSRSLLTLCYCLTTKEVLKDFKFVDEILLLLLTDVVEVTSV